MSDLVQKIADDAAMVILGCKTGGVVREQLLEAIRDAIEAARQSSGQERGEAVAPAMWQYRVYHTDPDDSGWGIWHDCHDASTATRLQSSEGYQVRPLYAAPTAAQSRIAELERLLAVEKAENRAFAEENARLFTQLTYRREREGRMREALENYVSQDEIAQGNGAGIGGDVQRDAEALLENIGGCHD